MMLNEGSRIWFWLLVGSISCILLVLLAPILTPFLVAAFLAYLTDPLADRLEELNLSRGLSVTIVFLGLFILLLIVFLLLVPLLESQIRRFASVLPTYIAEATALVEPYLLDTFGVELSGMDSGKLKILLSEYWKETGGIIRYAIKTISTSGYAVLGWVANMALIPVIMFYLLRDWDKLVAYIHDLLPRDVEPVIAQLARESDETLGAFLRGQMMVMLGLSVIYSVGLGLIGVEFALLIGLLSGIVSFVPYLGLVVGIGVAGLAVLFQTGDPLQLFWVFLVYGIAQMIEGFLLTPLLVGERIGLHPVTVIFAVLAGGQLFGFFGILLALPVAAILAVIMRHLHDSYKRSQIYQIRVDSEP